MQILEASIFGLRTSRMVFRKGGARASVTLFPMVHVGEARFYRDVYDDAFAHDVVLLEGVRSPIVRHLTRSYRWLNVRKLDLVVQPDPRPRTPSAARMVRADLTAAEFHRAWRTISPLWRAILLAAVPLVGLHRRVAGTRESIARGMSRDDRPSAAETLSWRASFAPIDRAFVHARDERLVECLTAELEESGARDKRIAIVYGAAHMRAVLRALDRRGFACADARWLTIFATG